MNGMPLSTMKTMNMIEDWNAEHESESDGYTYAYTKGHKDGMDNEVDLPPKH